MAVLSPFFQEDITLARDYVESNTLESHSYGGLYYLQPKFDPIISF